MRWTMMIALAAVSAAAFGQQPDMTPPKELGQVKWLIGKFAGTELVYFEGKATKSKSTVDSATTLAGWWIEGKHLYRVEGMGPVAGKHMLTYDPKAKMYRAYWFDQATADIMDMSGKLSGNTLTMISKPVEMPGMGKLVFRAIWTKASATALNFRLETKQGDKWAPMIVGTYRRR